MDLILARDMVLARMAQLGLIDDSLVPCLVFAIQINPDVAARLARAINRYNEQVDAIDHALVDFRQYPGEPS